MKLTTLVIKNASISMSETGELPVAASATPYASGPSNGNRTTFIVNKIKDRAQPDKKQARILHLRTLKKVSYQTINPHAHGTILAFENH
jgi:hypothetical protein